MFCPIYVLAFWGLNHKMNISDVASCFSIILCLCVCGFIRGVCVVFICSSSLVVPREECSSWFWHFLGIFTYIFEISIKLSQIVSEESYFLWNTIKIVLHVNVFCLIYNQQFEVQAFKFGTAPMCFVSIKLYILSWRFDHEIFSTVILSLPLTQEGQMSVSDERMCTILVNRLEEWACPAKVRSGKMT